MGVIGLTRARRLLLATLIGLSVGACDTGKLLDVDLEGRVTEQDLQDPRMAVPLMNSVIADVECSWDTWVAASSHHSDEWLPASGNANMRRWGLRDITSDLESYALGSCTSPYGLFTPLHTARFMAASATERIQAFDDAQVPNKAEMVATIAVYGVFPLIAFGETFCETPLAGGSQVLSPAEILGVAEGELSDAIALAQAAGLDDLVQLALVNRARVRLALQDYDGAIDDAELIEEGFSFVATRDATPNRRQNSHFASINGPEGAAAGQKHASVAFSYRDVQWKGEPDPRVPVRWDGGLSFDFATAHWVHDKVTSYGTPVMMGSWREAQLYIAEAAAMTGDLDRARDILDDFHTRAGIPPLLEADAPDQDAVMLHVIEERRRELFVEGGHRLRDHLRWRGTDYEVPFLGEPGSDFPDGVDQTGQPFESATCFPLARIEGP